MLEGCSFGTCCETKAESRVLNLSAMANTALNSTLSQYDADWTWSEARGHFESVDPEFHAVVSRLDDPIDVERRSAFESLARAIIGQQLSTKAAQTIWGRFVALHGLELTAEGVLSFSAEMHRAAGVSGQKHGYLQDLARHYTDNPDMFDAVESADDAAIVSSWTTVKGLGPWTVQMHLMFQLRRPDVFPVDDLGIRRSMERTLGIAKDAPKSVYTKRALQWGPFRTAASRFLWDNLDNQPK